MSDLQLPARWTDEVQRGSRRGARLPTRVELRALVAEHQMEIREVAAVGANPQQLYLDHREKVRAYAAQLTKDDAASFMRMYAEETTADTARATGGEARLAAGTMARPSRARAIAAFVVIVAVLAAIALLRVWG